MDFEAQVVVAAGRERVFDAARAILVGQGFRVRTLDDALEADGPGMNSSRQPALVAPSVTATPGLSERRSSSSAGSRRRCGGTTALGVSASTAPRRMTPPPSSAWLAFDAPTCSALVRRERCGRGRGGSRRGSGARRAPRGWTTTADRSERVFEAAEGCATCKAARRELGDSTAPCEEHLLAAMG